MIKKNLNKVISLLCMASVVISFTAITPLMTGIAKNFPNESISSIQFVITAVIFSTMISIIFTNRLLKYFTKKNMALISLSFVFIGGMLPLFFNGSIIFFYISSIIIGLGLGVIGIINPTLISEHFSGISQVKMMAWQSLAVNAGGAIFSATSGFLANVNWLFGYYAFVLVIIIIAIVYFLLPNDEKMQVARGNNIKLNKNLLIISLFTFIYFIFLNIYEVNISLLITEKNIGGTIEAGLSNALYSLVGGLLTGLILAPLIKRWKRNIVAYACFISALGMILISFSTSSIIMYLGSIIAGFGFAIRTPSIISLAIKNVDKSQITGIISLIMISGNLGITLSPLIINNFKNLIHGNIATVYTIGCIGLVISGLLFLLFTPFNEDNFK